MGDRLVEQLEEQEKSNRSAQSLQNQVHRLEGELVELTHKLANTAEAEKKAKEELEIRKEEKDTEVSDLQNEVSWFRGEYDQLLKKLNECEEELKCARNELAESQRLTAESEAKAE